MSWDWNHPLDSLMGYMGYQPNNVPNVQSLGNPQTTVNPVTVGVSGFTPWQANQVADLIKSNNILAAYNPETVANYLNQNGIGMEAFKTQIGSADGAKQFASLLSNNQSMARPDAMSWEGFLGNKNYAGWGSAAIQGVSSLGSLYLGYRGLKNAENLQQEQIALQRANYRNTAKTMNNQYRDQMAGRGYNGMSQGSMSALGRQYDKRRLSETY